MGGKNEREIIVAPFLAKILHPQANLVTELIYREHFERLCLDFPRKRIFYHQED